MKPECADCPVLTETLFRGFSSERASKLGCNFHRTHFRRNQVLFFEGGPADHLFALHSGLVKIVKSLDNSKERIVRVVFPGALFGLEALTGGAYSAGAAVLENSEICTISRDEFLAYLRTNADVALNMIGFLVGEVAQLNAQITSMSFKDARMRVATFLLSLLPPASEKPPSATSLRLPFTSQEISEILELSPETVSRAWSSLRQEGIIEKRGRKLVISDPHKLQNLASAETKETCR